mmetsp:Transcript_12238/g.14780  ORF Transcript_12238/g.14780 Transcript_12238/m.14780 type:complete len:188 (-) Transcript_12238:153-716(-)
MQVISLFLLLQCYYASSSNVDITLDSTMNPDSHTKIHEMVHDTGLQEKLRYMIGGKAIEKAVEKARVSLQGTEFSIENLKQKMNDAIKKGKGKHEQQPQPPLPENTIFTEEDKQLFFQNLENRHDPAARKVAVELARSPAMKDDIQKMLKDSDFRKKFAELHQLPDQDALRKELLKEPMVQKITKTY